MLCLTFLLFAIANCGAREISRTVEPEVFNITAVALPDSPSGTWSRIIGGSPTTITNFPHVVQVLYNSQLTCGGSVLTTRHVLSAAHCFVELRTGVPVGPRLFSIRAGATYLNQGGVVVSVSTIVRHENYVHSTHDNDVAVLGLNSRLSFGTSIQQAFIPLQGQTVADNRTVLAVGWGATSAVASGPSQVLNQVAIRIVNWAVCRNNYAAAGDFLGERLPITENMMCAGLLGVGGADACAGDSGGPLIYDGVVIGITSWGLNCAEPYYPGVYAQVSRYSTWINQTVTRLGGGAPSSHTGVTVLLMPAIFLILTS